MKQGNSLFIEELENVLVNIKDSPLYYYTFFPRCFNVENKFFRVRPTH